MSKMLKDCTNEKHLLYPALTERNGMCGVQTTVLKIGWNFTKKGRYVPIHTHMKLLEIKP